MGSTLQAKNICKISQRKNIIPTDTLERKNPIHEQRLTESFSIKYLKVHVPLPLLLCTGVKGTSTRDTGGGEGTQQSFM